MILHFKQNKISEYLKKNRFYIILLQKIVHVLFEFLKFKYYFKLKLNLKENKFQRKFKYELHTKIKHF